MGDSTLLVACSVPLPSSDDKSFMLIIFPNSAEICKEAPTLDLDLVELIRGSPTEQLTLQLRHSAQHENPWESRYHSILSDSHQHELRQKGNELHRSCHSQQRCKESTQTLHSDSGSNPLHRGLASGILKNKKKEWRKEEEDEHASSLKHLNNSDVTVGGDVGYPR